MIGWIRRKLADFDRSGKWASVRRAHLAKEPACVACGRSSDLEVHHCVPYHSRPDLELDPSNLITLCATPCHLVHGHLMNYKRSNPEVRKDAERYRAKMVQFGVDAQPHEEVQ